MNLCQENSGERFFTTPTTFGKALELEGNVNDLRRELRGSLNVINSPRSYELICKEILIENVNNLCGSLNVIIFPRSYECLLIIRRLQRDTF